MDSLILFCGGPAIYPGGVPKPLQLMTEERTLLDYYLDTPFAAGFSEVTLLCEDDYLNDFERLVRTIESGRRITVLCSPNNSSTLEKIHLYLAARGTCDRPVVFSYPDIFYFGDLPLTETDFPWSEKAMLSLRILSSRFPRIIIDPFSGQVRSISSHQSAVPANPVHMFGGHLIASPKMLKEALSAAMVQRGTELDSLEVGALAWMIGLGLVSSLVLDQPWMIADAPRDFEEIRKAVHTRLRKN